MSLLSNKENNPRLQKIVQKYKDHDIKKNKIISGTKDLPAVHFFFAVAFAWWPITINIFHEIIFFILMLSKMEVSLPYSN